MGLIQADVPLHFHGVWTWGRMGRSVVDLGGSMLDIRFIIIKSYLTAIWVCNAQDLCAQPHNLLKRNKTCSSMAASCGGWKISKLLDMLKIFMYEGYQIAHNGRGLGLTQCIYNVVKQARLSSRLEFYFAGD